MPANGLGTVPSLSDLTRFSSHLHLSCIVPLQTAPDRGSTSDHLTVVAWDVTGLPGPASPTPSRGVTVLP